MNLKNLSIVVAALAVASVATWLIKNRDTDHGLDPRTGQPILDADLIARVAEVTYSTSGKTITVSNTASNGSAWVIREYYDLPVDFAKLSRLISSLRDARIKRFATANPERMERFGFGDVVLTLRDADGNELWKADFGETTTSGGRYLRYPGEEKAYIATISAWFDSSAKNWADAELVKVKPDEVTALEVGFDEGDPLILERENEKADWTCQSLAEGEKLKTSQISTLLARLTGLRFTDTADPDAEDVLAAREHARTFKLTTRDGRTYTIALGRRPAPPPPPAPEPAEGEEAPPPPPAPKPGPVYAFITCSDSTDPINELMKRRAFEIAEYNYTSLPSRRASLVEAPPPPPADGEEVTFKYDGPKSFADADAEAKYIAETFADFKEGRNGLRYKVLKEGEGETPAAGTTVKAHYTGRLLDGTKFDSSYDRGEPFSFVLGQGQVIKGWDDTLIDMKKGEKRLVVIPYSLGYGEAGAGANIPPRATLVFEIELVDF